MKTQIATIALATLALTGCTAPAAAPPVQDKSGATMIMHDHINKKPLKQPKMKVSKAYLERIKAKPRHKKIDRHAEVKKILAKTDEYVPPAPVEPVVAPPAPVEVLPPVVAQPQQIETATENLPVTSEVVPPAPVQTTTPEPVAPPQPPPAAPIVPITELNWVEQLLLSSGLTPPADIRISDSGNCGGAGGGCALVGAGVMWISPTAVPHIVFHEYAHAVLGIRDECQAEEFAWSMTGDRSIASYPACR